MFFINNPDKVENYELLPWFKFKNTLFDIYDHRILHSPELNGSVNTNYCSLNEHLLVYYMDHYRTRDKAEEKIISLLINLRYYHEHWQRAKTFTWNMQLTVISDSPNRPFGHEDTPKSEDLNQYGDKKVFSQPHAYLKEQEISDHDIFCQEFFLYVFSLFS